MDVLCVELMVAILTLKHTTTNSRRELFELKAVKMFFYFIWKQRDSHSLFLSICVLSSFEAIEELWCQINCCCICRNDARS